MGLGKPNSIGFRFTRRVRHASLARSRISCLSDHIGVISLEKAVRCCALNPVQKLGVVGAIGSPDGTRPGGARYCHPHRIENIRGAVGPSS